MKTKSDHTESARLHLYRKICRWFVACGFLKAIGIAKGERDFFLSAQTKSNDGSKSRIWFHAASVGELESLTPVILRWLADGGEAVVTVFSSSAIGKSKALAAEAAQLKPGAEAGLLGVGYSPWEGEWKAALEVVAPAAFVTAKYEAWPDLWASLSQLSIPLSIVGAKARPSLRFIRRAMRFLKQELPALDLMTLLEADRPALQREFPGAMVEVTGDPRWDRVQERSRRGSARARELIALLAELPRPWGVLGSAWKQDLDAFGHRVFQISGGLWIVPHRVDAAAVDELFAYLKQGYEPVIRTSRLKAGEALVFAAGQRPVVLVDEMGFLSELYGAADWAFVGGGFGAGVHSTIEPAIHGIPIACGPARAERFSEIGELANAGQLRVVRDQESLTDWLKMLDALPHLDSRTGVSDSDRKRWQAEALQRMGATDRVLARIRELAK